MAKEHTLEAEALGVLPADNRPEVRKVPLTDVAMSDDGVSFSGYASVFDTIADLGDFTEEVRRGAYRKVLAQGDNVPMYWDHDDRMPPLATTRAGTLRLSEDATGLRVEATLDNDHYMTPTLRSMIRRGDVSGMSFGFVAGKGNQIIENRGGKPHRILTGFRALLDVSPTWNPAYGGTSIEERSALAEIRKARLEDGQQVVSGEYPQADDGADSSGAETSEQDGITVQFTDIVTGATDEVVEERDSGVSDAEAKADAQLAARRRRLQMMELDLAPDDRTWLVSDEAEARAEPPPRPLEEILELPRSSWSRQERERVAERRSAVHDEMFALTDGAERVGRTLTAEEREKHDSLSREFQRLGR